MKKEPLLKHKAFVLEAETLGFFKRTTLSETCTHEDCGYKEKSAIYENRAQRTNWQCSEVHSMTRERVIKDLADYRSEKRSSFFGWGRHNEDRLRETLKHFDAGCKYSWCKVKHPNQGPPTLIRADKAKCKRIIYRRYSDQELAKPDTKPDAIAILVNLATSCYHNAHPNMVALYDLIEDKWALDSWWTRPGGSTETLSRRNEHHGVRCAPPPSGVSHIDEVVQKLKESL
jgi:hypothetical protein